MTETVAPPHPFDAAVGLTPLTAGLSTGETNPAYNNMVGPFGGVTAATLLESVLKHPERLGDPLSLTVNFAGPITEGASRSPPGRAHQPLDAALVHRTVSGRNRRHYRDGSVRYQA